MDLTHLVLPAAGIASILLGQALLAFTVAPALAGRGQTRAEITQ